MVTDAWNAPATAVMSAAREAVEGGTPAALATVVAVDGSAYRHPGAKMIVPEGGDGVGSITAGCLEDDVLRIAADVRESGGRRVETFDLRGDDDAWGLGVGCNGAITVLFERLDRSYEPAIDAFESGGHLAVLTVLESETPELTRGDRAYWDGEFRTASGPTPEADPTSRWPVERLAEPAARAADAGRAETIEYEGRSGGARLFVEGVSPPADLVVFGTGHDVAPVVELGRKANFRTTVVGFRGGEAVPSRFPEADEVVSTSPANVREVVDFDESTCAVVMTHNYVDDRIVLDELARAPVPYIGLMGPSERFEELVDDLEAEDRSLDRSDLDRIYAPVGLDLGGGGPYQIAQSIVSEVLAVLNGRAPRHLREKEGPIHERGDADPSPRG